MISTSAQTKAALSTLGSSRGGRAAGFLPVWRSLVGADSELKKKKKKGNSVLLCFFCSRAAGGGREGSCGGVLGITAAAIASSYTPGWWVWNFKKTTRFWRRRWRAVTVRIFFFPSGLAVSIRQKKNQRVLPLKGCEGFLFYTGERRG